jgi:hypothetical protein
MCAVEEWWCLTAASGCQLSSCRTSRHTLDCSSIATFTSLQLTGPPQQDRSRGCCARCCSTRSSKVAPRLSPVDIAADRRVQSEDRPRAPHDDSRVALPGEVSSQCLPAVASRPSLRRYSVTPASVLASEEVIRLTCAPSRRCSTNESVVSSTIAGR